MDYWGYTFLHVLSFNSKITAFESWVKIGLCKVAASVHSIDYSVCQSIAIIACRDPGCRKKKEYYSNDFTIVVIHECRTVGIRVENVGSET